MQGLQQVVLYSLPELDGAIEPIVLGGLENNNQIAILPNRVKKLVNRVKSWVHLRKTEISKRKVTILVYGFPPNVGSIATAALLNVGKSIYNTLLTLSAEGYDVGIAEMKNFDEKLITSLKILTQEQSLRKGIDYLTNRITNNIGLNGIKVKLNQISYQELSSWLGEKMSDQMEKQWGSLEKFNEIGSESPGNFYVYGLEFGNVYIGIQPVLGIEGNINFV